MADNPFAKYAQPTTPQGVIFRDPTIDAKERRAEQQLELSRQSAARSDTQLDVSIMREQREAEAAALDAMAKREKLTEEQSERQKLERAQASGVSDALYQMRNVIQAAKDAKAKSNDWFATGFGAGSAAGWGGTSASDIEALLNTVGSNTAFDRLQKMREESPTGGALGAVSEVELRLLRDSIASLSQTQSDKQFQSNMQKVIDAYTRVSGKLESADNYYRSHGSMDGYTPPTEEELATMANPSAATSPLVTPPSMAGGGATQGSVPIDPDYQAKYEAFVRSGDWTPEQYDAFRRDLDSQFDYVPAADYLAEGQRIYEGMQNGAPLNLAIPPINQDLSTVDQARNDLASSELGALLAGGLNAGGLGIPGMLAGDQMDMIREESPVASFLGEVAGGVTGTGLIGAGLGKVGAAAANPRVAQLLANPMTADAAYGGIYGAMEADDPLLGAVAGVGGAVLGNKVGSAIGKRLPRLTGLKKPADTLGRGERAVMDAAGDIDPVIAALNQAGDLNVPATIADVSPGVNSLTGAAIRKSPDVAGAARAQLGARNREGYNRFTGAVERDLGPVENIPEVSEALMQKARAEAGPLYDEAYAAGGLDKLDLTDLVTRPSMKKALANARRIAQEEGRNPDELGFVFDDSGDVILNDVGRFADARGARPAGGSAVISGQGKRAPADIVTFVRQNGGLRDTGGELKFMDADNKGRMGTEFAGQDQKFGRLVNPDGGRDFDEMSEAAWEAGYFGPPDVTPRPTEREFLEALEDTFTGSQRKFSVFDEDVVNDYRAAQSNMDEWRNAEGMVSDQSVPAGPDVPFAPLEAYGSVEAISPTWQTIDYVKRGLDDVLEGYRDKTTGKLVLDTEGRAVNDTLQEFLFRTDIANPAYAQARSAYAGPAAARDALARGQKAVGADPNQLGVNLGRMTPDQTAQSRLGFQSALVDQAGRVRNNSNPFLQLDSPQMERRLGTMYEGDENANVARLLMQRDLEGQMAGSSNRLVGNSLTAERQVADEAFGQTSMMGDLAQGALETAVTGAPVATALRSAAGRGIGGAIKDYRTLGMGRKAVELADEIGPIALNDDPLAAASGLTDMAQRQEAYRAILDELLGKAAVRGGHAGAGLGAVTATGFNR